MLKFKYPVMMIEMETAKDFMMLSAYLMTVAITRPPRPWPGWKAR